MRKGQKMPEHVRQQIVDRMKGNRYGRGKHRIVPEDERCAMSERLKAIWAAGKIRPRQPMYSPEEINERRKQQMASYYKRDREKVLERQRHWHAEHPGRKKEISARYHAKHRDRLNAKQREENKREDRKTFMRDYLREHRKNNPEMYRTYSKNRRALHLGADGSHTLEEWIAKQAEFDHRCGYCGTRKKLTEDHAVPLARGGSNLITNIVPACGRCNSRKGTLTAEEFVTRLAEEANQMPLFPARRA